MQNAEKYLQIFIDDSRKELAGMNGLLQCLQMDAGSPGLVNELFRKAHSLKGMAATMGFTTLTEVSHALEEPLNRIREGKADLTRDTMDLLYEGVGLLEDLVNQAITGAPGQGDHSHFLRRLKSQIQGEQPLSKEERTIIAYQAPRFISVETRVLDDLINLVGEMIIQRSRLTELIRPLASHELEEQALTLANLIRDFHDQVIRLRMTPLSSATDFLLRMVRDLSYSTNKEIDCLVEGDGGITLDRTVLGEVVDALIHLIRNAVDHGIEPPRLSRERGKMRGKIWLRFFKLRDTVKIEVEDNGQGIDPSRIKELAIEEGIITKEESEDLTTHDTLMLLCRPGFTTTQLANTISGRGVGLDVVKEKVEKLGGGLQIASTPAVGSKFTIHVPSTTHIIFALLVKVNRQTFAIPISILVATTNMDAYDAPRSLIFQDQQLPLLSLRDLLKIGGDPRSKRRFSSVVVVERAGEKAGMIVDELLTIEQIFVKPLGVPLCGIEGFLGATILGDGRVVLVLDLERLR